MERPQTRYVDVGGAEVAYQIVGQGPPDVVYVPGFSHVDLRWEDPVSAAFLKRLASFSRLILFDRRGTGASAAVPDTAMPTWEEWADDVGAVLDAAGSERTVVRQRLDPRAKLASPRHLLWWDHLDLLYFGGSALWTYMTSPFIFASPGFQLRALDPWQERGEIWRRLEVAFSPELHTHSHKQVFYVGPDGLIRRQDYTAEEFGPWARSAHYCDAHRDFHGLVMPTRRRVFLRRADNRPHRHPVLIWLVVRDVSLSSRRD